MRNSGNTFGKGSQIHQLKHKLIVFSFSIVGGNPARVLAEWPPTCQSLMVDACAGFFDNFQPETTMTKKDSFIIASS